MIGIEVVYALPNEQVVIPLHVPENTTVADAIQASKILWRFPEINLTDSIVGIFGKTVSLATPVKAADRIEIYRPLLIDPKQARLLRAQKKR
jgi:putative ubiquitin-RnfH superfamily antitoxin RatB of RatAB toxin-antitoxin module